MQTSFLFFSVLVGAMASDSLAADPDPLPTTCTDCDNKPRTDRPGAAP